MKQFAATKEDSLHEGTDGDDFADALDTRPKQKRNPGSINEFMAETEGLIGKAERDSADDFGSNPPSVSKNERVFSLTG